MRKVFWCGCAVTAAVVAGAMYFTAWWVDHQPTSLTAQGVRMAWHCAMDWNPVVQVGRFVGEKSVAVVHRVRSPIVVQAKPSVPCCAPADPGPEHSEPPVIEVIDLGSFEDLKPQDEVRSSGAVVPAGDVQVEVVPPGAIEEAEPAPPMMPPADDAEVKVPPSGWCDFWMNLYREDVDAPWAVAEELPMPHEAVTAEVEELPMPQSAGEGSAEEADAPPAVVPDCRETPDVDQSCPECPASGCPGMKGCPSTAPKLQPVGEDKNADQP